MPLFRTHKEGELLLGVWKVEETVEQLRGMLEHQALYEESLSRFVEKRKREWLAVRVLLTRLCGEEKEIAYRPSGKPFLADGSFHIGISHTTGYVAVALHPSREVGVDIEQYGTRIRRVASRILRPDEKPVARGDGEIDALLLHWSAKETLFKLMDEPGVDWSHLRIRPFTLSETGFLEIQEYYTTQQECFLVRYVTHPDFVLTWTLK